MRRTTLTVSAARTKSHVQVSASLGDCEKDGEAIRYRKH